LKKKEEKYKYKVKGKHLVRKCAKIENKFPNQNTIEAKNVHQENIGCEKVHFKDPR